ncbi:hypothetical protein ACIBKY_28850 [Nonomuraea sp. NPDC050394]|uniref:hypothetical protein n=1 Tax=Nonomuraea sp. NPDC050394 TaxID=3364363 RepID=UPI00378930B8
MRRVMGAAPFVLAAVLAFSGGIADATSGVRRIETYYTNGDPRLGGSVVLVERCVFPGQRGAFRVTHTITAMSWPYGCG